ncbi:putative acylamino-acid-releasing enzyme [Nemania sp. FL0031]|nr:putative acylamino-acid-releasing enzyme [Nemania sp. FL0031]
MAHTSSELIDSILDLPLPTGIQLSPDGLRVIYTTTQKWQHREGSRCQKTRLWEADTGIESSARPLTSGEWHDRSPRWAPDGKSVAFISDRASPGRSSAIYKINGEHHEAQAITEEDDNREISTFAFSPSGNTLAFLRSSECHPSETEPVLTKGLWFWGQSWKEVRLNLLDMRSGSIKEVGNDNENVTELAWNDTGTEIAFLTYPTRLRSQSNCTTTTAYLLNVGTHSVRRIPNLPKKASNLVCMILVHLEIGMEDRLLFLGGSIIYSQKVRISSYDGLWMAWGDLNNPTEVFTQRSGNLVRLSNHAHGTRFTSNNIGSCMYIECPTLDGSERLDGLFITPNKIRESGVLSERSVPLPTFVLIHGGPYSRITNCFEVWHPFHMLIPGLLCSGYAVLIPNYRGSSGRGEKFASYARGGMGRFDQPDIIAMVQYAIMQGLADKTRLIVAGWSQGGYLAYLSAVRNGAHEFGWHFAGAVAGAGITDWDSMTMSSDLGDFQAQLAGSSPWNSERSDLQARAGSAIWAFKRAATLGTIPPMLMLHGASDQRVPLAQAIGFQRALDDAQLPYQLIVYPDEGHYLKKREHIKDMLTRVLAFSKDLFSKG